MGRLGDDNGAPQPQFGVVTRAAGRKRMSFEECLGRIAGADGKAIDWPGRRIVKKFSSMKSVPWLESNPPPPTKRST